jgi:hypothetical protein
MDEAIKNHHAYPDIWIDDVDDPAAFYSAEIMGTMLVQQHDNAAAPAGNEFLWDGEGLLARACALHRRHKPLIVLDPAGGIGYLEFRTATSAMADAEYTLLLDDTHHLKHFRSARDVEADPRFRVLAHSHEQGWLLAHHPGN